MDSCESCQHHCWYVAVRKQAGGWESDGAETESDGVRAERERKSVRWGGRKTKSDEIRGRKRRHGGKRA